MAEFDGVDDRDERMFIAVSEEDGRRRRVSELEIVECVGCAALVPADQVERHVRWHRHHDQSAR